MAKSIIIVEQIHAILHSSLFILLTSKKKKKKKKIKKYINKFLFNCTSVSQFSFLFPLIFFFFASSPYTYQDKSSIQEKTKNLTDSLRKYS